jgi:hypothetical protein
VNYFVLSTNLIVVLSHLREKKQPKPQRNDAFFSITLHQLPLPHYEKPQTKK